LDFDESKVYLTLLDKGPMTVLQISRATKISRTNVYRIADKLKEGGFLEEKVDSKKLLYPVGMHKLEMLVKEQENRAEFLRNILPDIATIIPAATSMSQPDTKVLFYRGVEGIKQMVWNTLQANNECVGYTYRSLKEIVGEEFAQKWEKEFTFRKLKFRDLIGDEYLQSVKDKNAETYKSDWFETRFISSDILDITHQVDIYNDVVAYYAWHEDEIFGVEIYNKKIAKLQKQLFEVVWRLGASL